MNSQPKTEAATHETIDEVPARGAQPTPDPVPKPTVNLSQAGTGGLNPTVNLSQTADFEVDPVPPVDGVVASRPTIGGYEIIDELGRGGMGVVYRAKQKGLDRLVAIKMLLAGEHAGSEHHARFQTEAQAVATLQHPNIVQIYEVGEHNGLPFFSLEFVPGGTLSHKIAGKPQPAGDSARLVELIARAMQAAHNLNIVHRDLKPANILLAFADHSSASTIHMDPSRQKLLAEGPLGTAIPKISDFGLAKRLELNSQQTRSGAIMGSPSYMAPEQARGEIKEVGPLADVYSIGTILYELLTGRPPFLAATAIDTVQQVANSEPVPPSRLEQKVPRDLETICLKCLQKDPRKRYPTAEALADDLHRFQQGEPILARPVSTGERLWRWCRRNPRLAAAIAASIFGLVATTAISLWAALSLAQKNVAIQKEKDIATQAEQVAEREAAKAAQQQMIAEQNARDAIAARVVAVQNAKTASEQATTAVQTIQLVVQRVQERLGELPGTQEVRKDIFDNANAMLKRVAPLVDSSTSTEATQLAIHQGLGNLFGQFGESAKALDQFQRAEAIARERVVIKQGSDASRSNLARVLRDLGQASQEVNRDMSGSRKYYEEALQVRQGIFEQPNAGDGNAAVPMIVKKELSEDHTRVAATIYRLGSPAAAVEHFRKAFEFRRELVAAMNTDAVLKGLPPREKIALRQDFARSKLSMGEMSFRLRDPATAVELYGEGVEEFEQLVRERPSLRLKHELGRTYGNYGDIKLHIEGPAAALSHYDRCRSLLQELVDLDPNEAPYLRDLGLAHYRLGNYELRVKDAAAAAEHFQASLKIREDLVARDQSNDRRQMELMLALAHCGEHARAAAIAEKYHQGESPDNELLIDVSRCYAQCSAAAAGDGDLQKRYAEAAVVALRAAVAQDYRDAIYLESEPDLDPLRDRDDFKAILVQANSGAELPIKP
jgi:serine/threonine protein kinase